MIKNFLNPEGHQNCLTGSRVTAILLKGWILLIGGDASGFFLYYLQHSELRDFVLLMLLIWQRKICTYFTKFIMPLQNKDTFKMVVATGKPRSRARIKPLYQAIGSRSFKHNKCKHNKCEVSNNYIWIAVDEQRCPWYFHWIGPTGPIQS